MTHSENALFLYDKDGKLHSVQLSAAIWEQCRNKLEPYIQAAFAKEAPTPKPEPLHEWEELKQYWDFKYPISTEVHCDNCGANSSDWENDPAKPFRLKGANLGGLVVFSCAHCGATIRKKHFKDHICFEYSTTACGR